MKYQLGVQHIAWLVWPSDTTLHYETSLLYWRMYQADPIPVAHEEILHQLGIQTLDNDTRNKLFVSLVSLQNYYVTQE